MIQPLERATLHTKTNKAGTSIIYGTWRIPANSLVPRSLAGAETRIRHNSTPEERQARPHRRRTRALSALPQSDPHFAKVYGARQDSESIFSDFKSRLRHSRARSPGADNLRLELAAYQLHVAVRALIAYSQRTGDALQDWFGNHYPARAGPS